MKTNMCLLVLILFASSAATATEKSKAQAVEDLESVVAAKAKISPETLRILEENQIVLDAEEFESK